MPAALATSAVLHLLLIALLLRIQNRPAPSAEPKSAPGRKVEMIDLPPLPKHLARARREAPKPAVPPAPMPPPLAERDTRRPSQVTRDPASAPGHAATPTMTEPSHQAAAPRPAPETAKSAAPSSPAASAPSTVASAAPAPTMESEARRLFGPHPSSDVASVGPLQPRSLVSAGAEGSSSAASDCRPTPHPPHDPSAPPELVTIVGHILRRDDHRPLAGAHLQMIGTPYSAFTDDAGRYEFRFSEDLIADCRTQQVRVEAPGYRTEWVYVVASPTVQNSDLMLQAHRGL